MSLNSHNGGKRYTGIKDITPADATDIEFDSFAIKVDVAGNVKFSFASAPTVFYTEALAAQVQYPIGAIYSIESTGTTATGIKVYQ